MTEFDYAVLLAVGISVALGAVRGLIREAFSLAGWFAAFIVANAFSVEVAGWLRSAIYNETARVAAAFVLLFVMVLILTGLSGLLLSKLFRIAGFGVADRALGAVFGLVRGVVIALVVVMVAGFTALPQKPYWRASLLAPPLETAVIAAKPWMPHGISDRIRYQ
jgi:membrane protein required for colicin V production